jgi:hypothetical protein
MKSSAQVSRKKKAATKKPVETVTKSIVAESTTIEAQYQDDGKIEAAITYYNGDQLYTGCTSAEIGNTLNQMVRLFAARKGSIGEEELLTKVNASLSVFTGMKPKDSIEAMMITQMIALHEMTLLESERALLKEQPDESVEKHINRATKFCRSHASLVEAFNKYRTKGRQKITVQHVNVNDGGQAIVGDVNQGGGNG